MKTWRVGLYAFLIWLVFEDLPRKFLGNNMAIYFAKDALLAMTYLAFWMARRGRVVTFRAPFHGPLLAFFLLAALQVFNSNSPSLFYGLMGMKLYFYYAPLMFVSYALLRSEEDLGRLMSRLLLAAPVVAVLGIVQAVVGHDFLNPPQLAPELEGLGRLTRTAPISGVQVVRPSSVFVSDGRFGCYMLLMLIVSLAAAAYAHMTRSRWRLLPVATAGLTAGALYMLGSRGALVFGLCGFAVLLAVMMVSRVRRKHRIGLRLAVGRSLAAFVLAIAGLTVVFGQAAAARWLWYVETLSPASPSSELVFRARDYPMANFLGAFDYPEWLTGYGTGTASLGGQYVTGLLGKLPSGVAVENGYGNLILEFGVLGPVLWLAWSIPLVASSWRVVQRLKGTPLFPVGFSILWFAFLLLFPFTWGGLTLYQNFVFNAYFWALVGILFRLPALAGKAVTVRRECRRERVYAIGAADRRGVAVPR
jgi:hypothetical protein